MCKVLERESRRTSWPESGIGASIADTDEGLKWGLKIGRSFDQESRGMRARYLEMLADRSGKIFVLIEVAWGMSFTSAKVFRATKASIHQG